MPKLFKRTFENFVSNSSSITVNIFYDKLMEKTGTELFDWEDVIKTLCMLNLYYVVKIVLW